MEALVDELNNTPGQLLPGVQIVPYYDRSRLVNTTTETVRENMLTGMALVCLVLLVFLGNLRSSLIVAINVPLAVLVAFSILFLRGDSANLLSIGAVDFGILAESSVFMVENIYRYLSQGLQSELPLRERILHAANEIERSLFFSTAIMVCAFLPLFTLEGPAGQIFKPMANTYAFALAGADADRLPLAGAVFAAVAKRQTEAGQLADALSHAPLRLASQVVLEVPVRHPGAVRGRGGGDRIDAPLAD